MRFIDELQQRSEIDRIDDCGDNRPALLVPHLAVTKYCPATLGRWSLGSLARILRQSRATRSGNSNPIRMNRLHIPSA
jgi:hypothetical protein